MADFGMGGGIGVGDALILASRNGNNGSQWDNPLSI